MDLTARVLFVILSLLLAVGYQWYRGISKPLDPPKLDLNAYWGPGDKANYKENPKIVNNRIIFPDEVIEDLKTQLSRPIKFHDPLEGVGCEYGFNTKELTRIVKYWKEKYLPKWKERENYLWKFPHFTTQIQGLQIHFLHTKKTLQAEGKKVYPVLLLHGWPGSIIEFYDVIPKLAEPTKDRDYIFEVVVPSLPGYGWSEAASKPGLGPAEISVIFKILMHRLGYEKFFIQGGDWGSNIGRQMATLFPENIIGYHSNFCISFTGLSTLKGLIASYFPSYFVDDPKYYEFFTPIKQQYMTLIQETGYMHIQGTKPDTVGIALTDNPLGLSAYMLEKFSTWTNPSYVSTEDGNLEKEFNLDRILDNIMIYYLTNSMLTSMRLYKEAFSAQQQSYQLDKVPTSVPSGCTRFKYELFHVTDWQLKDKFLNLIHSTYHDDGGHFAALQKPDVLYNDFIEFVEKVLSLQKS